MSNVGGGAASGDVESMRKDLDKILGRDEHGTAQVRRIYGDTSNDVVLWNGGRYGEQLLAPPGALGGVAF